MAFGQNSGSVKKRPIAPRILDQSDRGNSSEVLQKPKMSYSHLVQLNGAVPSVERRNARERNRVKQVNNGFDRLRQYIPRKIIEMENGGRGPSKKLSKVDTLRLVVKYIHGLQHLLDEYDNKLDQSETVSTISTASSLKSSDVHSSIISSEDSPQLHSYGHYNQPPVNSHPDYQNHRFIVTYSEPSISPTPSYHSDTSPTSSQPVYYVSVDQSIPQHQYNARNVQGHFEDDSGGIEEDGILDDILHWQLQNS